MPFPSDRLVLMMKSNERKHEKLIEWQKTHLQNLVRSTVRLKCGFKAIQRTKKVSLGGISFIRVLTGKGSPV